MGNAFHRRAAVAASSSRALVLALALALVASPASREVVAAEPLTPAERLHEAAVAAHQARRMRQAIELWRDALALEPNWKYAYNLANTQYEVEEGLDAWHSLAKVDALSPPEKYAGLIAELRSKVRALLYRDHAWLVLQVTPAGARVTRDGEPWAAPHDVWLTGTESRVRVEAEGYEPWEAPIAHPIGDRTEAKIVLKKVTAVVTRVENGTLRVDGTPAGARVTVGGIARGVLPLAPLELPPGPVDVVVQMEGYDDDVRTVDVASGAETPHRVALEPLPQPIEPNGLATPGWASVIGGVVVAGVGAGFFVWAGATRDDMNALNQDAAEFGATGYEAYQREYGALESAFDDRLLVSNVLLVAGGAAMATGVVLILLDDEGTRAPDAVIEVVPVTGGGAVIGRTSF